ncbi:MAG TPA: hypothetical protein VGD65_14500 [Chryseosolibacter sp.]
MKHLLMCLCLISFGLVAQDQSAPSGNANASQETAAPSTAVQEGRKIFDVVGLDINSKVFSRDLPFDVPFIIEGPADHSFTRVEASYIGDKNASVLTAADTDPRWKTLSPWEKTILSTDNKFYIQSPDLAHNQFYKFRFKYSKEIKPTPTELLMLRSDLVKQVKTVVLGSCVVQGTCNLSRTELGKFHTALRNAAVTAFGSGVTIKPNSIFDSGFDDGQITALFTNVIDSTAYLFEFSQDFDPTQALTAKSAYDKLATLFSAAGNRLIIDDIARGSLAANVKEDFAYLLTLDAGRPQPDTDALLQNGFSGYSPLKVAPLNSPVAVRSTKHFALTFDRSAWKTIAGNYRLSYEYIDALRKMVRTLIDTPSERFKLRSYNPSARNRASVDATNKSRLTTLETELVAVQRLLGSLTNKAVKYDTDARFLEMRLAVLSEDISKIAVETLSMSVNGTTSAEFKTRANWYVSADLGMVYMFGNYGLSPYLGTNVYLRPINKQAPLHGWMLDKRFAFLIGINLPLLGSTSTDSQKLFNKNPSLLTGAGLRLSHALRINGGLAWMKLEESIITQRSIGWTPFCSISFDINVGTVFNKLLPSSLDNSIQNTVKK